MPEDLDLNRKQQRAADKLALARMLEGSGSTIRTDRAERRLTRAGVDLDAAAESGYGLDALDRISRRGALGGKRAKRLAQNLSLNEIEREGDLASSRGQEDIARAYQTLSEQFAGTLGAGVDVESPAVLDAVRRYVEGRSTDTTRYLGEIERRTSDRKAAVLLGEIAPTLDETGALVESLRMLDEEQDLLRRAQMGSLIGGIAGAGLGFAFGGGTPRERTQSAGTGSTILGTLGSYF